MNSIDANQKEKNHEDLNNAEAAAKIKELVKQAPSCFFCTEVNHGGGSTGIRPMGVQKVDDNSCLWFLSAKDSHKNLEILNNSTVKLLFQGSSHSDFMHLNGTATISYDKGLIKDLWEPILKTWFTDGVDDERISAIKVEPASGYYWDKKHGHAVAGVKMLIGAIAGKTLDDSIEGELKL